MLALRTNFEASASFRDQRAPIQSTTAPVRLCRASQSPTLDFRKDSQEQPRFCAVYQILNRLSSNMSSMPPSSPRLPSPPPPTEIQIGPQSPSVGSFSSHEPTLEQSIIDANAARRIHPGTKAADMAAGPPLVPLGEVGVLPPNKSCAC